jgi:peptidylprolyl isomerase
MKSFAILRTFLCTLLIGVFSMTANAEDTAAAPAEAPVAAEPNEFAGITLPEGLDAENALIILLKDGPVIIKMLPDAAPNHVARIKELAREDFYDGIVFHRVIDGFMAQTGDPTGTGTSGSGKKLKAEFNDVKHKRGVVSMARASSPDSADSQFFIVFKNSPFLNNQYTAWGEVVAGMEHVDAIKKGDPDANGSVSDPDKMLRVEVAADVIGAAE